MVCSDNMEIEYTDHARVRLYERRVSKKDVKRALYDGSQEDAGDGLIKATHRNQKGVLIVIYSIKDVKKIKVVTAYWK